MLSEQLIISENRVDGFVGTELTVVEDEYPVGQFADDLQVVGGQDQCPVEAGQNVGESASALRVEIGERFVESQAAGMAGEHSGQAGSFSFSERESNGVAVGEGVESHIGQRLVDSGLDVGRVEPEIQRPEGNISADGRTEELIFGVLEQQSDAASDAAGVAWCGGQSVDQDIGRQVGCVGSWRVREQSVEV